MSLLYKKALKIPKFQMGPSKDGSFDFGGFQEQEQKQKPMKEPKKEEDDALTPSIMATDQHRKDLKEARDMFKDMPESTSKEDGFSENAVVGGTPPASIEGKSSGGEQALGAVIEVASNIGESIVTKGIDKEAKDSKKIKKGEGAVVEKEASPSATVTGDDAAAETKGGGVNGMAAAGAVAGAVGGMLPGLADDGDEDTYSSGEVAADIGSAALEGAAAGAQFGPWGAAAGGIIGGVKGWLGSEDKKSELNARLRKEEAQRGEQYAAGARNDIQKRTSELAMSSSMMYGERIGGNRQAGYGRNGMKFIFTPVNIKDTSSFAGKLQYAPTKQIKIFKKGGKIKPTENIIPNGVLHEEDNSLGDKGMPVVKCSAKDNSCTKHYEIEKDEMILTLGTTKKIEELAEEDSIEELGNYMMDQILDNTHSFTDKYEHLNGGNNETIFS